MDADSLEEGEGGLDEQHLLVEVERHQVLALELRSDSIEHSDADPDEVVQLRPACSGVKIYGTAGV